MTPTLPTALGLTVALAIASVGGVDAARTDRWDTAAVFSLLAIHFGVAKVNQNEMDVGAARNHIDSGISRVLLGETLGKDSRTVKRALLTVFELI